MQKKMLNEAKKLAEFVKKEYPASKERLVNATNQEIIIGMAFDKERLASLPDDSKKRIETCCKTVNGFCYMMALDTGVLKKLMNFRSLQFTSYMDKALDLGGFPKQSFQQKQEILKVMGLDIEGWEKWSGDKK